MKLGWGGRFARLLTVAAIGISACSSEQGASTGGIAAQAAPVKAAPQACTLVEQGNLFLQHIDINAGGGPGGPVHLVADRTLDLSAQPFKSLTEAGTAEIGGSEVFTYNVLLGADESRHIEITWGPHVHGAHAAVFDVKAGTMTGSIDGRAIVPAPADTDPAAVQFADGKPSPMLSSAPPLADAFTRLQGVAADALANCGAPPPAKPLKAGGPTTDSDLGNACCYGGETCLNPISGLCCSPGKQACVGQNCCGSDESCISVGPNKGTCCLDGQTCGGSCCPDGQFCADPSRGFGMCCPNGTVYCPGQFASCIDPKSQVCNSDGTACNKVDLCGNGCCGGIAETCVHTTSGSVCCDSITHTPCGDGLCCDAGACAGSGTLSHPFQCCAGAAQACGDRCCNSGQVCVNGSCQDDTVQCGQGGLGTFKCEQIGHLPVCCVNGSDCAGGQCCPIGTFRSRCDPTKCVSEDCVH